MSDEGAVLIENKKRETGMRHRDSIEGEGKGDWLCSRRF